jgi:hypothetical protein
VLFKNDAVMNAIDSFQADDGKIGKAQMQRHEFQQAKET